MIPNGIESKHIKSAIQEITNDGVPSTRESVHYDLLHSNERYPPKYVISLAAKSAFGKELPSDDFHAVQARDYLRARGYTVIDRRDQSKDTKPNTHESSLFKIGREYQRKSEIHGLYQGQSQSGISTPKNFPYVFIFTSDEGEQHGYKDEYRDDGIFWYTGEGQVGDMKMGAGNKAILEHAKNNKTIHVFEYTRKAYVRYLGSAECLGYHEESRPDREGGERKAFVFHLDINSDQVTQQVSEPKALDASKTVKDLKKKGLKDLREAALNQRKESYTVKEKREIAYYRSEALKRYVVARSQGKCDGCGCDAPFVTKTGPFLECHHVHRLSDGGPDHPQNVVALCPNCHRRAHYAKDAESFNKKLITVALEAEKRPVSRDDHV